MKSVLVGPVNSTRDPHKKTQMYGLPLSKPSLTRSRSFSFFFPQWGIFLGVRNFTRSSFNYQQSLELYNCFFFSLIYWYFDFGIYQPTTSGTWYLILGFFFFYLLVPFVFNVILQFKKEKEKSSINLIKPNTPLMNKTLNEPQDLIENAQTGRSIAKDC